MEEKKRKKKISNDGTTLISENLIKSYVNVTSKDESTSISVTVSLPCPYGEDQPKLRDEYEKSIYKVFESSIAGLAGIYSIIFGGLIADSDLGKDALRIYRAGLLILAKELKRECAIRLGEKELRTEGSVDSVVRALGSSTNKNRR